MATAVKKDMFDKYIYSDKETRQLIVDAVEWDDFCDLKYETEMIQEFLRIYQDIDFDIEDHIVEMADYYVTNQTLEIFSLYSKGLRLYYWYEESLEQGYVRRSSDMITKLQSGIYFYNKYILQEVVSHLDLNN